MWEILFLNKSEKMCPKTHTYPHIQLSSPAILVSIADCKEDMSNCLGSDDHVHFILSGQFYSVKLSSYKKIMWIRQ